MKIEIAYNKEWLDITKYIDTSISIGNQSRIDDVFALGQFTAILNISENIPPYTPMKINGVDYLCSSVATKHFSSVNNRKTYYHNFTILEATAILSCYILGSKSFSITGTNKKDIDKVGIVLDLMNYKYKLNLRLSGNWDLNKEQELNYGSGTTLYDFLSDILKAYNYRIKVNSITLDLEYKIIPPRIELSYLDLNEDIEYSLDLNKITYVEKLQNTDLFSDIIEGEMVNVVDRDITSYANGLVTSSDDIKLTEDNAFIQLPTNAENVKEFGVEGYIGESSFNFYLSSELCDALGISQAIGGKDFTFEEKENVIFNGIKIMPYIYERFFSDISSWEYFKKIKWQYNNYIVGSYVYWAEDDARFYMKVDITNKLLEKSQWNLLEAKEKPKYVWYQTNTNKIQGVNTYYKDNLWNNLVGGTVYPFLYHLDYITFEKEIDNIYFNDDFVAGFNDGKETTKSIRTVAKSFTGDYNPLNYTYYIKYNPIINPMILENKNNRNKSYFNISRSYGKQASYIDYDKLINSLNIVKESEGLKELKLELDLELDDVLPTAGQCIYYENEKWYISNIVYSLKINHNEMTLNCVKNYNKTADVIGVETQFNSTKNPLNGIVDRSIYVEFDDYINYNDLNQVYVKLTFKDSNGIIISNAFKKCSVAVNENKAHLYCEADDQYSIGNQGILQQGIGKVYLNKHYPYVDINNELYNMDVEIVKIPLLNLNDSHLLPEYNGSYEMLLKTELIPVFKDAREKLLFTFKVNNIII